MLRRRIAITTLLFVCLAGVALAANFLLTKTGETNSTITFSYPQQAGADGYRYYAPGTLNGQACTGTRVSRTLDPTKTSVKFSKVPSGQYCVEAIVLSPIGAAQYPASPPPPTGTYYLAPTGSDTNACSQAAPCATFQRGYAVANPGETVCVAPGNYGSQQISYVAGKTTPAVVIKGCGGTPSVLSVNFGNGSGNMPRALTIQGPMAITGSATTKAVTYVYTGQSLANAGTDITFDNIDIAVGKATPGQAVEIIGGTQRLTIKNSRIGPICCGRDQNGGSPVGIRLGTADRASLGYPVSTDTVIDHNVIKGITRLCSEWLSGYGACPATTCPNTQDLCHEDAIQVYGSDNLRITNNQIYHVGINGIFLDSTDPNTNGTIANNMIGDVMRGATCFDVDGRGIYGTWNIINNTCPAQIGDGYYISWASTMDSNNAIWNWKGNVGAIFISSTFTPSGDCTAGTSGVFTYAYNTFSTNNGGAVGCPNNTTVGEPAFVNTALDPADTMDLHLAGPAGPADNKIPTCFVSTDIDGQARPQPTSCDAGADERNATSGGAALANIWVSNATPLGSCQDSPTPVPFDQATSCGNLDAANNTCDTGDLVYVKTALPYSGEAITDSNSRFGACTIEAEPGTGDIIFTGDISLGVFGSTSGPNGPDWLTIRHVQCGSPTSFQNEAELFVWSGSDNIVLDDWDCASFDVYSDGGVTIKNGDWGPCGSSSSRKCVPRVARSNVSLIGNKFHDIQCGTGSASQCDLYHTDGLAIFGGTNILISGNLFYRNDITNIRFQSCCGNTPLANITVENNVFMQPCIDAGTGPNCTDGFRGDGFDFDSSISGAVVRFNTFADQAYPQCTGPTGCGTSSSPALFVGNIFSQPDGSCSQSNTTQNYNASSPWGGGSGCGTGTNRTGPYPTMVNPSNTASPPNMRLTGAPTIADNLVASGCIATDADGKPRPPSGCDAGAYER